MSMYLTLAIDAVGYFWAQADILRDFAKIMLISLPHLRPRPDGEAHAIYLENKPELFH